MKYFLVSVIGIFLLTSSVLASSTQTTLYFSSLEKNLETGEQRIYYGAGNSTVVRNISGPAGAGSSVSYLHPDHLSGTALITRNDGAKETSIVYYPYGKEKDQLNLTSSDKFYTGQRKDISSDLYFYNARYYDPKIGHFISADKAQGPNRYAYVGNNPIMRNDPSGNQWDPRNPRISASGVIGLTTGGYGPGAFGPGYLPGSFASPGEQLLFIGAMGAMALTGGVVAGYTAVPALLPYAYLGYTTLTQTLGNPKIQFGVELTEKTSDLLCAVGVNPACTVGDVAGMVSALPSVSTETPDLKLEFRRRLKEGRLATSYWAEGGPITADFITGAAARIKASSEPIETFRKVMSGFGYSIIDDAGFSYSASAAMGYNEPNLDAVVRCGAGGCYELSELAARIANASGIGPAFPVALGSKTFGTHTAVYFRNLDAFFDPSLKPQLFLPASQYIDLEVTDFAEP